MKNNIIFLDQRRSIDARLLADLERLGVMNISANIAQWSRSTVSDDDACGLSLGRVALLWLDLAHRANSAIDSDIGPELHSAVRLVHEAATTQSKQQAMRLPDKVRR